MYKLSKENTLEQELNLEERRPLAGEVRRLPLGEALFFSPKPIPSAKVTPGSLGESNQVLGINETYMDIGLASHGKAFQVQLVMSCILLMLSVFISILLIGAYVSQSRHGGIAQAFIHGITKDGLIGFIPIFVLFLIGWFVIIKTSLQKSQRKPIRFNRQRREVCYFDDKNKSPTVVPWENVVSWVVTHKGFTGDAFISDVTFGLALPDAEGEDYWMFKKPVGIMEEGQRSWEIIRCYMEEGPEYWATMAGDESRKTFDETRLQLKQDFRNGPKYLVHKAMSDPSKSYLGIIGYYLFNILSGWKLPYLVSEWDSKISMAKFPDEINKWSEPIPEHEWAKPSKELLKQKARAEAHYAAGGNLATLKL